MAATSRPPVHATGNPCSGLTSPDSLRTNSANPLPRADSNRLRGDLEEVLRRGHEAEQERDRHLKLYHVILLLDEWYVTNDPFPYPP